MRLIGLAVVLALSLFSASLAAEAQATRTPRIGYLGTGNATPVSAQLGQCPGGWPVPFGIGMHREDDGQRAAREGC